MKYDGNQARPRHLEKRIRILLWILRFGYVDKITVMHLIAVEESTAAATLKSMTTAGLIARLLGHGVSCWLYRLTPSGERFVHQYREAYDEGIKALTNPTDIGVHYSAHNLVAQRIAAQWIAKKNYRGQVIAPRQMRAHNLEIGDRDGNKGAWKIPDALLLEPVPAQDRDAYSFDDFTIAIEVQQSTEAPSTRAYKLWQYWKALVSVQITDFIYYSTYSSLVSAYERHWKHELEERVYSVKRHRWQRPEKPLKIEPDNELLENGKFLLLEHDPFGKGLYPSPESLYRGQPDKT